MKRSVQAFVLVGLVLAAPLAAAGQGARIDVVGPRSDKTYRATIQHFAPKSGGEALAGAVSKAVADGLDCSGLFSRIDERAFLEGRNNPLLEGAPAPNCPNWRQIGADALVQGEVESAPEGVRATFRLFDVSRGCLALVRGKRFTGRKDDARRVGKAIADEIVGAFTGQRGVSDTELAFVSNHYRGIFSPSANDGPSVHPR